MPAATPGTPSLLRAMNDRAALELLLTHGPLSRTRIGHLTGLSKPTASQLLARLEAAGLVVATGTDGGRPGPSAQLYAINPRAAYVGGLDVTPGRVLAAVADLTGTVIASHEVPYTEGAQAVDQVTEALGGAVKAAGLHRSDLHRVVIATPGAFDPHTGRLRYASHLPGWHSPTLLDDLAAALPMPVEYENDVNLAAVAEQRLGAARGHEDFVLLWNEEGLGAALVLGGRLHRGWTGGAGEVGFLPVPGLPLVRQVTRANSGGYQELAYVEGLPWLAAELGVEAPPGPAAAAADADAPGSPALPTHPTHRPARTVRRSPPPSHCWRRPPPRPRGPTWPSSRPTRPRSPPVWPRSSPCWTRRSSSCPGPRSARAASRCVRCWRPRSPNWHPPGPAWSPAE